MNEIQDQIKEQQRIQQEFLKIETQVKHYLTKEAIMRYGTLKTAHPETAVKAIVGIMQAIQNGQITEKITDQELKKFLMQIQDKKTFNIKR